MRANVMAPAKLKDLRSTQNWLTVCLSYWFVLTKILRCLISLTAISKPKPSPFSTNASSLTLLICHSFSLSLSSVSPLHFHLCHSTKIRRCFMIQYHCNKLIESKWLFQLGIAHNNYLKTLTPFNNLCLFEPLSLSGVLLCVPISKVQDLF